MRKQQYYGEIVSYYLKIDIFLDSNTGRHINGNGQWYYFINPKMLLHLGDYVEACESLWASPPAPWEMYFSADNITADELQSCAFAFEEEVLGQLYTDVLICWTDSFILLFHPSFLIWDLKPLFWG